MPSAAVGTGLGNYTITYVNGTLTVSPKALTITANNRSKTYGDTVTFAGTEFTTVGLVGSDTVTSVTLTSAGAAASAAVAGSPYSIVPSAAVGTGLGNYTITYVNGTLTVSPKALSITANADGKSYDGLAYTGGNGVVYSGFVNSENATVLGGSLAYGGTSQGAIDAGSYQITPSGLTSSNYTISFFDGTLTVDPAALTITANADAKSYDGLAYTGGNGVVYSGFVNSENATVLGGALAYGGTSQGAIDAGSYQITPQRPDQFQLHHQLFRWHADG